MSAGTSIFQRNLSFCGIILICRGDGISWLWERGERLSAVRHPIQKSKTNKETEKKLFFIPFYITGNEKGKSGIFCILLNMKIFLQAPGFIQMGLL